MPSVRKPSEVVPKAILVSDIHLSHTAPVSRSAEPDWYAAMERQLVQLQVLKGKYRVPAICAGDLFHKWNSSPELINFAMKYLPHMHCIPGQHDLPLHSYDDIRKSAYWTLVQAGTIEDMRPGQWIDINGVWFHAVPWGHAIPRVEASKDDKIQVAVIHAYIWTKDTGYPGADEKQRIGAYKEALAGYDVALFGDNHKGFLFEPREGPVVYNHGTFYCRTADERTYRPHVGVLMSDGTVKLEYLDTSEDKWFVDDRVKFLVEEGADMDRFLEELNNLGEADLDFREAMKHYMETRELSPGARKTILQALET
jgi:hypothetical protein